REGSQTEVRQSLWLRQEQGWASPREHTADTEKMGFYTDLSFTDFSYLEASPEGPAELDPGLVVYARVDGSFSVWDSHRNVQDTVQRGGVTHPAPRVFAFSYRDVMDGLKVLLDDKTGRDVSLGLINEWREWQLANKPQFELLKRVLAALGPDDEPLTPGEPRRPYLDDAKDIPTIQMGYGQEVPITLAPAGVKRAAMLAYVLTWAISEHRRLVDARASLPARSVILLIDEPETHLHPRWQRTILPSLLKALEVGFGEPKVDVQMFVATHSPLVLASLEPHFDPALDALWKLDLVPGANGAPSSVKVERDEWRMRGDVGRWLRSDVFDMASAYSLPAERAISRAKAAMKAGERDAAMNDSITAELKAVLPEVDPFLFEWSHFLTFIARGGAR
ncbi:ATP-binding protein, partial [Myxococcota bacterium]|nr:ATP-binding protein [Myxococcota bacterium]